MIVSLHTFATPMCALGFRSRKFSSSCRSPLAAAIHVEPMHSPTRRLNQNEHFRAYERRSPADAERARLPSTARSIVEQVDALMASAQRSGRGEAGRLAIGFYTSLAAGNLRATLFEARLRLPQLEVGLFERSRSRLITALRSGVVDIVIVPGATSLPDSNTMPRWSERIMVLVGDDHPLAAREAVYWADLKAETLLLSDHDPGPEFSDLLVAKLACPGGRPKISHHDVSRGSLWCLVGAGFGLADVRARSNGRSA